MKPTFVIGDIHGHYSVLVELLHFDAQVIQRDLTWSGGDATVCLIGDYVDRGSDGIKTIDFLISLQIQAEMRGGQVIALNGNHEHVLLSAHRFGDRPTNGPAGTFKGDWLHNGGVQTDLDQLTPEHIAWITHLPSMLLLRDRLIVHGDAMLYTRYGQTIDGVNRAIEVVMSGYDPEAWERLLEDFNEHRAFWREPHLAKEFLTLYGGTQIIHGHTPISGMTDQLPESVTKPLIYADGLCINVDGGIYRGGPGFVYEIPPSDG